MAVAVVDLLEVVQVDDHERARMPTPRRPLELDLERALEAAPVRDTGERIDHRLLGDEGDAVQAAQQRARERGRKEADREQRDERRELEPSLQGAEVVAHERRVRHRHEPRRRVVPGQRHGLGPIRLPRPRAAARRAEDRAAEGSRPGDDDALADERELAALDGTRSAAHAVEQRPAPPEPRPRRSPACARPR